MVNNPLKYTDPTGHSQCQTKEDCEDMGTTPMGTGGNNHQPKPKHAGHHHHDGDEDDPDPTNGLVIPTLSSVEPTATSDPTLPLSTLQSSTTAQSPIFQTPSSSGSNWGKIATGVGVVLRVHKLITSLAWAILGEQEQKHEHRANQTSV